MANVSTKPVNATMHERIHAIRLELAKAKCDIRKIDRACYVLTKHVRPPYDEERIRIARFYEILKKPAAYLRKALENNGLHVDDLDIAENELQDANAFINEAFHRIRILQKMLFSDEENIDMEKYSAYVRIYRLISDPCEEMASMYGDGEDYYGRPPDYLYYREHNQAYDYEYEYDYDEE